MSSVASLELCKELYELIGWGGNDRWYMTDPEGKVIGTATPRIFKSDRDYGNGYRTDTPAYDLGYLIRKLTTFYPHITGTDYAVRMQNIVWSGEPENEAARLCIDLLKEYPNVETS